MAAARRVSAALSAQRQQRDDNEERRESKKATHGSIISLWRRDKLVNCVLFLLVFLLFRRVRFSRRLGGRFRSRFGRHSFRRLADLFEIGRASCRERV